MKNFGKVSYDVPSSISIYADSFVGLTAQPPVASSLILIMISILITLIGGLLPAKKAAKKDPVIALRSE